jgi:hypothetical protein
MMRVLVQVFLIGGGFIGLIITTPVAWYAWSMHRAFDGHLTSDDKKLLYSPFVCAAALVVGIVWSRLSRKS